MTVSKQDTGFAITGDGEVLVQAIPTAAQKEQDAFDGSHEEYLDWFGSYFINFVRSKDVLLQFNTEKECSELVYDFDSDGVFDDVPILGDADGNGKPYEPSDIYWTARHIARMAFFSAPFLCSNFSFVVTIVRKKKAATRFKTTMRKSLQKQCNHIYM